MNFDDNERLIEKRGKEQFYKKIIERRKQT